MPLRLHLRKGRRLCVLPGDPGLCYDSVLGVLAAEYDGWRTSLPSPKIRANMVLAGILALACTVFGIGLYVCAPSIPVAIALPASFLVLHVGGAGGGNNFSLADAALLLATLCALPLMHWRGAVSLRRWMVLVLIYQATTLLSVVNSPNRYDAVEWFHQILMVAGAAVVGWVTVERGRVRMAFRGYILIAAVLSVWVIGLWFAHGFHTIASLPYGLQKNGLGVLFVIAVLAVHLAPSWIEFADRWIRVLKYVCIAGVISTGSRQAMFGLVVGCTYSNHSRSRIT